MTSELDNFLSNDDERRKKQQQADTVAEYERRQKTRAFGDAFQKAFSQIIHPAMVNVLDKLRKREYAARVIHDKLKIPSPYPCENYYIAVPGTEKYFIISVIGNHDLQKVCIETEYMEHFFENGVDKPKQLKKTEGKYDLTQLTPELFESLVINAIKEIMPITIE